MSKANTGDWLGSMPGERRDLVVTLFVPSQTRDGDHIDHDFWRTQALTVMTSLFGGATAVECQGAWRDDERGGGIKLERNSTVQSYMAKTSWNNATATELAKFLHYMGRESNQGEIGLVVDGVYFPIREFKK
jgi:hypothetical protein